MNDLVPKGERAFVLASCKKSILDGDTPVKLKHFSKKQEQGGSS